MSRALARYVNSPNVSIGIDFLAVPADTVTRGSEATKFATVLDTSPGALLIITSFKSRSSKSPEAVRG